MWEMPMPKKILSCRPRKPPLKSWQDENRAVERVDRVDRLDRLDRVERLERLERVERVERVEGEEAEKVEGGAEVGEEEEVGEVGEVGEEEVDMLDEEAVVEEEVGKEERTEGITTMEEEEQGGIELQMGVRCVHGAYKYKSSANSVCDVCRVHVNYGNQ